MKPANRLLMSGVFVLAIATSGLSVAAETSAERNSARVPQSAYCQIGQPWPGFDVNWIDPGVITGDGQTFCALVDPRQGCGCPLGFEISTLDMFMAFADYAPVPTSITISMGVKRAVPDPSRATGWSPGGTLCETPVRDFTFYIPKPYVGMGIALECGCAGMEVPHFLFFTIHSHMDSPGGLYTNGNGKPKPGRFLTLIDDQWVDMVSEGLLTRGDLVISGFAQCCEHTVPTDAANWGAVKALYR